MGFLPDFDWFEGAVLVLSFAERVGVGAEGMIERLTRQVGPVAADVDGWTGLRVDVGRYVPGFFIGQLRTLVGNAEGHVKPYVPGQTRQPEQASALVVAVLTPQRGIGVAAVSGHQQPFPGSLVAALTLLRVYDQPFGWIGRPLQSL